MKSNIFKLGILALILLFSISFVSASHFESGPSSYALGYGYSRPFSYSNTANGNLDFNRNSFDLNRNTFNLNRNALTSNNRFSNLNQDFRSLGFLDSILQNLNQDSSLNLNDGYSFTKGPCTTKVAKVNFHGRDNDFKITQEVCDNIQGNFFKNNQFSNSASNNLGVNRNYFGASLLNNRFSNEGFVNQNILNQNRFTEDLSQSQNTLQVSFGKGDIVVFN
ncbi:MAG: hypothetical protein AABY07_02180 [Nanoarchaeota archaeon]